MVAKQRIRMANEKHSKNITQRGNVAKSTVTAVSITTAPKHGKRCYESGSKCVFRFIVKLSLICRSLVLILAQLVVINTQKRGAGVTVRVVTVQSGASLKVPQKWLKHAEVG